MAAERNFTYGKIHKCLLTSKRETFLYLFLQTTVIMKIFISLLHLTVILVIEATGQIPSDALSLWLKADNGVQLNNNKVIAWNDQSGNKHDATSLSSNAPLLTPSQLNGLPCIRFNGLDNSIETVPFQTFPGKRGTISMVIKLMGKGKPPAQDMAH